MSEFNFKLPSDWQEQRVDSVFDLQQGKQVSRKNRVGNNQRHFLRTKNVYWGNLLLVELDAMNFTIAEEEKLKLNNGDLLVCEGGDIGRTAIWEEQLDNCYYQNHLHRLRAKDGNFISKFGLYWFWYAFETGKVYFGRGNVTTIPNLSSSKLAELPIVKPSLPEQRKIAAVLSTVQKAIETQAKLIERTMELKKAMMHKLFTEGTRGEKRKMTEIGPVPESWEVEIIGKMASIKSGGTPDRKNPTYWNNGTIPWIKTGEIDYCIVNASEEKITQEGLKNSSAKLFPKGTLLMAMYGQGITRGKVAILGIDATTNQAFAAFLLKPELSTTYLFYYFSYHYNNVRNLGHGANQKNLSADIIKTILISYPIKLEEQNIISNYLTNLNKKIDYHTIKKQKLEELFRTLLHQLMTAQIRVNDIELENLIKVSSDTLNRTMEE